MDGPITEMTDGLRSVARQDRPDAPERVAALEAENAALRRALGRAGLDAERHGRAAVVRRGPETIPEAVVRAVEASSAGSPWRLIEAAPNPYLLLRPDPPRFTIAAVSDAYLRATMTRRDDIIGRGVFEALTDDPGRPAATGVRNLRASLHRVLAARAPDRMPVQRYDVRRPDGAFEERHWCPRNLPVLGADGGVEAIIHYVEDVTEFGLLRERSEAMEAEVLRQAHAVARANADLDAANAALRGSEERLREAEARQTFLLRLADALRPLHDPEEVQAEACRLLAGHLGVAQVGFGEIDAAQERVTVRRDWNDGRLPSVVGTWRMDDFGPAFVAAMKRGEAAAIPDIARHARTNPPEVAAPYPGVGPRAVLDVPLVKGGRMATMLFIHHPEPRPWSAADVEVVEETCERLWAAVERAHAEERLRESEARWRGLFERMQEGFALCEMVYGPGGEAADFRYLEVNAAWGRLTGIPGAAAIGRLVTEAIPGIEPFWAETYARVVETGEPAHVERPIRSLGRWFEVRAYRVGPGRFAALFTDVTGRKRAEERQAALLELGDRLRDLCDAGEIARTAAEVIGRTLGGTRAGCGIVDMDRGVFRIERDWTDGRASSIAGELRIADFWADLAAEFGPGEVVAVEDAGRDPRTAARAAAYAAAGVRAFLDVPLVEAGRVAAILFVHDAAPRAWTAEEIAFVRGVADRAWAAAERARAEERRALLVNEVNHRAKNAVAVVQAMLRLTEADDVPTFIKTVEGRVAALARAHTTLANQQWAGSSLHDLVRGELAPFMAGRATIDGPAVTLPAVAAQPIAMAVHELATNAAKHGALSAETGTVAVAWRVEGRDLRIRWTERGGPPIEGAPERSGFGSRLLDGTIRKQLRGTVERTWDASGLVCDVVVPLGETHGDR